MGGMSARSASGIKKCIHFLYVPGILFKAATPHQLILREGTEQKGPKSTLPSVGKVREGMLSPPHPGHHSAFVFPLLWGLKWSHWD